MKRPINYLVITIVFLLVFSGCFQPEPLRLKESKLNSLFIHSLSLPFDSYIKKTRQMVEKTRVDLKGQERGAIIAANSPFELLPDGVRYPKKNNEKFATGVLLIHGLSDSPYHMRSLGEHLRDKGFLVRAILLPGHGTVPGDLTTVTYGEWIKAVRYGVEGMKPMVDHLFIAGFSTGGALGVYESLVHDDIDGLLLFSPALAVRSSLAFLTPFLSLFKTWLSTEEDKDFSKYESFAMNGAAQIYSLTKVIKNLLKEQDKKITIPVFAALSYGDDTVDPKFFMDIFNSHMTNPDSRVLLYAGKPLPEFADNPRISLVNSSFNMADGAVVVDFAHTSITLPPEDPHYGKAGDYRSCLHYKMGSEKRMLCLQGKALVLGEKSPANLRTYDNLQRLTFNPLYKEMVVEMDRFLHLD